MTAQDGLVQTFLGGGIRTTSHPSYQAWSYAEYLGFNETVELEGIHLQPCAFLHNCTDGTAVLDKRYAVYTEQAPVFLKQNVSDLRGFLEHFVQTGDNGVIMDKIDHGRIRPSKSLADSLVALLKTTTRVHPFRRTKSRLQRNRHGRHPQHCQANASSPKQVLIVRGGPGTGKSVVAINLLVSALAEGNNAAYVTKNAAPRDVYESKLTGTTGTLAKTRYRALFKGSGAFVESAADAFDALIVDEAHRLNEKSGLYANLGENQIKEIIDAARCSVFFLDEDQQIHINDIGSEDEIRRWAEAAGAEVTDLDLPSQFRCKRRRRLPRLRRQLQAFVPRPTSLEDMDYEFRCSTALWNSTGGFGLQNAETGKARLVAGYCWDWVQQKEPRRHGL